MGRPGAPERHARPVAVQVGDDRAFRVDGDSFRRLEGLGAPTCSDQEKESWREGRHDDLILVVAVAAWLGEQALTAPGEGPDEPVFERIIVV